MRGERAGGKNGRNDTASDVSCGDIVIVIEFIIINAEALDYVHEKEMERSCCCCCCAARELHGEL